MKAVLQTQFTYNPPNTLQPQPISSPLTVAMSSSLDSIPQELLEHIAFYTATDSFLGPPAALVPLLATSRKLHSCLSIEANHHLYARIFAHKFDLNPPARRLGAERLTLDILARELQHRCRLLKRLRTRIDATLGGSHPTESHLSERTDELGDVLLQTYVLMLENEGKNEEQLRKYAGIDDWLKLYYFNERGASKALSCIRKEDWPPNDECNSLAMWLLWFLLKPGWMAVLGPKFRC